MEYRDQDGNLLNEEQVKALEGKVEFKTRYETRTRVVDAYGNEIVAPEGPGQAQGGSAPGSPPSPNGDSPRDPRRPGWRRAAAPGRRGR